MFSNRRMMATYYFLLLFLLWALPLTTLAQVDDLSVYRWENRILVLSFFDEADALYGDLNRQLAKEQAELLDRDLVVFHLFKEGNSHVEGQPLSEEEVEALRQKLTIHPERPTLVLIGKDGGQKLRQTGKEIRLEAIYPLIDSMPMRKAEMRRKMNGWK